MHSTVTPDFPLSTRREMLHRCGMGLGLVGLTGLLADDGTLGSERDNAPNPLAVKQPHFPARAKHVIHLFMNGGASQVDTFDPKPELKRLHGQTLPVENLRTERKTGHAMKSPFRFSKYGESGIEVSEIFAKTAQHVDDMAIIRSMYADVPNHEPSLMLMNCGDGRLPRPSFGAWATYGLGSENQTCRASSRCAPAVIRLWRHKTGVRRSCLACIRAPTSTRNTPRSRN